MFERRELSDVASTGTGVKSSEFSVFLFVFYVLSCVGRLQHHHSNCITLRPQIGVVRALAQLGWIQGRLIVDEV